jgi:hypothetical protein
MCILVRIEIPGSVRRRYAAHIRSRNRLRGLKSTAMRRPVATRRRIPNRHPAIPRKNMDWRRTFNTMRNLGTDTHHHPHDTHRRDVFTAATAEPRLSRSESPTHSHGFQPMESGQKKEFPSRSDGSRTRGFQPPLPIIGDRGVSPCILTSAEQRITSPPTSVGKTDKRKGIVYFANGNPQSPHPGRSRPASGNRCAIAD